MRAVGGGGGWGWGDKRGNHIKFSCYICQLYGDDIDRHVLDFKWKSVNFFDNLLSVNFDNLSRNKIFGLQLFVPIESFLMHVSGIRPW